MRSTRPLGVLLALALSVHVVQAQETAADLLARATATLGARSEALVAFRHDLHRHPEPSGQEVRTAGVVADRLEALGLDVRRGVGGHGVVGVLQGGRPGPVVAFRADMDAVVSSFPDPVEYRSLTPGVRHICGHDVHVTVALGVAEALAPLRHELAGSVVFVFQPAEENATGARAMLADGVFEALRPDAIYAVHTAPFPVGQLATAAGGMMAGRDLVTATIRGDGDLAAAVAGVQRLIAGVGTIPPAMALAPAPEGYVLAQLSPQVEAPQADTRVLRAQITTASPDARARTRAAVIDGVAGLAVPGVNVAVVYDARAIAGVTNDAGLVTRANAAIAAALGDSAVILAEGIPPAFSEDFGSFQDHAPGVMYFLGVSNPERGTVGMPHTPAYVADDGAILVGATAMTAVVLDRLLGTPPGDAGDGP